MATMRHHAQAIMETTLNAIMERTRKPSIVSNLSWWDVSIDHKLFKQMHK
jgi:hypothetical protein